MTRPSSAPTDGVFPPEVTLSAVHGHRAGQPRSCDGGTDASASSPSNEHGQWSEGGQREDVHDLTPGLGQQGQRGEGHVVRAVEVHRQVVLEIHDEGPGMPDGEKARAFEGSGEDAVSPGGPARAWAWPS